MPWVPEQDGETSGWVQSPGESSELTPPVPTEDLTPSVWSTSVPEASQMTEQEYQAWQTALGAAAAAALSATGAETARTGAEAAQSEAEGAQGAAEAAAAAAAASAIIAAARAADANASATEAEGIAAAAETTITGLVTTAEATISSSVTTAEAAIDSSVATAETTVTDLVTTAETTMTGLVATAEGHADAAAGSAGAAAASEAAAAGSATAAAGSAGDAADSASDAAQSAIDAAASAASTSADHVSFASYGGVASATVQGAIQELDDEKAPKNSPDFTGTPTVPTQAQADNSTKIASTAYVRAAVATVLGGVASAFDTLAELATAIATKADLNSAALTGNPTAPTQAQSDDSTKLATTAYVRAAVATVLGGVSSAFDTLAELATAVGTKVTKAGDTMTGSLVIANTGNLYTRSGNIISGPADGSGTSTFYMNGDSLSRYLQQSGGQYYFGGNVPVNAYSFVSGAGGMTSGGPIFSTGDVYANTSGRIQIYGWAGDGAQAIVNLSAAGNRYIHNNNTGLLYFVGWTGIVSNGGMIATDYRWLNGGQLGPVGQANWMFCNSGAAMYGIYINMDAKEYYCHQRYMQVYLNGTWTTIATV